MRHIGGEFALEAQHLIGPAQSRVDSADQRVDLTREIIGDRQPQATAPDVQRRDLPRRARQRMEAAPNRVNIDCQKQQGQRNHRHRDMVDHLVQQCRPGKPVRVGGNRDGDQQSRSYPVEPLDQHAGFAICCRDNSPEQIRGRSRIG